jgi:RND family efflux transporter MFP subunit
MSHSRRITRHRITKWLGLAVLSACGIATTGVIGRVKSEKRLEHWTIEQATPTVKLISAKRGGGDQELVLPGDVRALFEAPIHARVSGYVRAWRHDIGARVRAGEVLASVDAPELDQQLEQAKGELAKAEANLQIAKLTSKRWSALRGSIAVSQQSVDEKASDVSAKAAEVASAQANVERLKALEGFTQITAPFAGVVTARNVDIGALVAVGGGGGKELFSVADIHQVRVYVRAPQAYASQLRIGMPATLKLPQYPNRKFTAKLVATSNAISQGSRTLLVQLLADNADEALLPGSFVEVRFKLPDNPQILRLPASALLFRDEQVQVATLGADEKIVLKNVEVARDLGSEFEIASGIDLSARIIDNPSESIGDGDVVRVMDAGLPEPSKMTIGEGETQGQAE